MNFDNLVKYLNKQKGVFIEAGANDGIFQSYTYPLERDFNWSGVLIEPSINVFNSCVKNRPNSICINSALTDSEETKELIGDFDGNPMASVNGERLNRPSTTKVSATTLNNVFKKYFSEKEVNLISLDVENYELQVLRGLDLLKYRPDYILIEIYTASFDSVMKFFQKNNYFYLENITKYNLKEYPNWDGTHNDFLFVRKELA
jgi:FkbM family methyltransferase